MGNVDTVKLLLEFGANPFLKSEGRYGDMLETAKETGKQILNASFRPEY